jgi:hypothetical protein
MIDSDEVIATYTFSETPQYPQKVKTPQFSPDSSYSFTDTIQIEIYTETEGATIVFSTNDRLLFHTYISPITISNTVTFHAFATNIDMDNSDEVTATYIKS